MTAGRSGGGDERGKPEEEEEVCMNLVEGR